MDFVALFEYPGPTPAVLQSIQRLEHGKSCAAFRAVVERWREDGFAPLRPESAEWQVTATGERSDCRPNLPDSTRTLRTSEHFYLSFGQDAVCVYHPLRWLVFLTMRHWQSTMLNALAVTCQWLRAGDCFITSDSSAAFQAFHQGSRFPEILDVARKNDGEVKSVSDLYQEQVNHGRAFAPGDISERRWPREIPLPPGWQQSVTPNSKGFWSFPWPERVEAYEL